MSYDEVGNGPNHDLNKHQQHTDKKYNMSYKRISYLQNLFYSKQNLKLTLSNKNSTKTRRSMFLTMDASQEEKRREASR